MHTEILVLDGSQNDINKIQKAGKIIREGGLVAFPTETVYGLGANALDVQAVKGIFKAKGRPSDNPLIVHIYKMEQVNELTHGVTDDTKKVMKKFWPGPITFVLPKSQLIPKNVTAGLSTVGLRMPDNKIALELLKAAQVPIAAPSANISGKPSPTTAQHVIDDLYGKVDIIIDGGDSTVGVESTVIDMTLPKPAILRPGGITPEKLEKAIGEIYFASVFENVEEDSFKPKAPGMKYKHYSPKAEVIVVTGENLIEKILKLAEEHSQKGISVGIMCTEKNMDSFSKYRTFCMGNDKRPIEIAQGLFNTLRRFDSTDVDIIIAEGILDEGIGLAIMNRLCKAAGYNFY